MRIEDDEGVIYPPPLPTNENSVVVYDNDSAVGYYTPPTQGPYPRPQNFYPIYPETNDRKWGPEPTKENDYNIDPNVILNPDAWGDAIGAGVSSKYGPIAGAATKFGVDWAVDGIKKNGAIAWDYFKKHVFGIKGKSKKLTPEQKEKAREKVRNMDKWLYETQLQGIDAIREAKKQQGKQLSKKMEDSYTNIKSKLDALNQPPETVPETPQITYEQPNSTPSAPAPSTPTIFGGDFSQTNVSEQHQSPPTNPEIFTDGVIRPSQLKPRSRYLSNP